MSAAIALGLAAVLIGGIDGRYYFLRAIQWLFGTDAMMWVVTAVLPFHSLDYGTNLANGPPSARFGLIALCVTLIGLGVHPRRFGAWRYLSVFLLGAAIIPLESQAVVWMGRLGWTGDWYLAPGSWQGVRPFFFATVAGGIVTAAVLWWVSRSIMIAMYALLTISVGAWLSAESGAAIYGSGLLMSPGLGQLADLAARWLWHPALLAMLLWWALRARRRWRPPWACQKCGYDMRGTAGGTCPECGTTGGEHLSASQSLR